MDRTDLYPKRTSYLFSFDADLSRAIDTRTQRDVADCGPTFVAGFAHDPDSADELTGVYNALGDSRELGERSIRGHIRLLQERVRFRPGREFGELEGRVVIDTVDHESIEGVYAGVFRAGPEWHWLNASAGARPNALARAKAEHLVTKAFISVQFDAGNTKYAWLARYQCVGYGRLTLKLGCPSFLTFDIYALDQPS